MARSVFIILSLLLSVSIFSQTDHGADVKGTVKLNFNFNGKSDIKDEHYNDSLSTGHTINTGYSVSLQLTSRVYDFVTLGVGLGYQFQRTAKSSETDSAAVEQQKPIYNDMERGNFGYIPVYAIAKVSFFESDIINPNLIGHFGYNLFYGDNSYKGDFLLEGGIYYAGGVSLDLFKRIQLDVLYEVNNGAANYAEDQMFTAKYSYITLSLGFVF